MAEPVDMPFWMKTRVGPRNHVLDEVQISQGKVTIFGVSGPGKNIGNLCCSSRCSVAAAFTARRIIQSPITSYSRRDRSVCQASANSTLQISGRRNAAYRPRTRWLDCTARAKFDIYDCIVVVAKWPSCTCSVDSLFTFLIKAALIKKVF